MAPCWQPQRQRADHLALRFARLAVAVEIEGPRAAPRERRARGVPWANQDMQRLRTVRQADAQAALLSDAGYPSTIVLPITTKLADTETPVRLRLPAGLAGLDRESDVLVAQLIAVANESFRRELGSLPPDVVALLDQKLRSVLNL